MRKNILTYVFLLLAALFVFTPRYLSAAGLTPMVSPQATTVTVEVDGSVSKQIIHEGHLYLSGSFSEVQVNNAENVARSNFAQIDLDSRTVSPVDINVNGVIEDMVLFEDTLYLGGSFTQVSGQERNHLASLNRGDMTLDDWNPSSNDTVYALLVHEGRLYVGGAFTRINDQERFHIASFILPSGELSTWSPRIESVVRELRVENGQVVVEGDEPVGGSASLSQVRYTLDPDTSDATTVEVQEVNVTTSPAENSDALGEAVVQGLQVDTDALGFAIPTLSDVLTFAIRAFFVIGGLAALFFLLMGAFGWVTSGGDKDSVAAARDKIQAAIIGLIMMVVVLGIVWTLEQVVFNRRICLGVSCPVTIPSLLEPPEGEV